MDWLPLRMYTDKKVAVQTLASLLQKGSLSLYLGAGVSVSSGQFPSWVDLVRYCVKEVGIAKDIKDDEPIDSLLDAMDSVRRKVSDPEQYKELVRTFLSGRFILDYSHLQNYLLIALGALLMPSKRGSIKDVITYNFDDLLEWYLGLHGHDIQVVTKLPYLYEERDVKIYHPHGFLPKVSKYDISEHFVFDQFSYDITIGREGSPWFSFCKKNLFEKVALMIGLSGKDPAIRVLLSQTFDELTKLHMTRPVAFLLNRSESVTDTDYFLERGIVPLGFDSFDDIWQFILSICQEASE
jgi:hypothetical protein